MRLGWKLDPDRVACPNLAPGIDDAHDTRLADELALLVTLERCGHQPLLNLL